MREVRDLLRRCVSRHAQLRDAFEYLQDDEEADHDDRRQIDDADEQPEEDERRDARRRVEDEVRAEDTRDRA